MQRRTFLSLLAIPAVAQFLQACGTDSGSNGGANGAGRTVRGRTAHVDATAIDAVQGTAAINAFANDLFEHLVSIDETANLVFSPASIAVALAMTSTGAQGATAIEMDKVLHVTDDGTIAHSLNGVSTLLESANRTHDNTDNGGKGTSTVELSVANSLWAQSGFTFEQAFLEILSSEYDAGVQLVDYHTNPEAARAAVNAWVKAQTKNRIPELLAKGTITDRSRLTLVNAIYLKANWETVFDATLTAAQPFHGPNGDVTAQMMHRSGEFAYVAGDGWQAVDIPYVFGALAFTVAVGDNASTLMPTGDEVFPKLTTREVHLGLPRFDIQTATDLRTVLTAMGMVTAFTDKADFSGITETEPLMIGAVIHQANITVDEVGTEAAAATAVVMVGTAAPAPEPPVTLTVDRPFTFWLREVTSGTIVFMGRVNDPHATR